MSTYEWLLIGHLLGVFLILMAAGVGGGTQMAVGRAKSASGVVALLELQRTSDLILFSIGGVVAVVFGSLLVDEAGFGYGDMWVSAAYTIVFVMFGVIHGLMAPRARRALEYARDLGEAPVDDELRRRLSDPLLNVGGIILTLGLLTLLYLMVAKPGA